MELHKNDDKLFKKVLIYDLQDIQKALKSRNDELMQNNKVMDYTDPDGPHITDLPVYLESTKKKGEKRTELNNQDFFYQAKTPGMDNQVSQKGTITTNESSDMYNHYGPSYKQTYQKIMGQMSNASKANVKINDDTSKPNR